jgi:hypothetical protein
MTSPRSPESLRKNRTTYDLSGPAFTARVQDRRDHDRDEEDEQRAPEAPGLRREPLERRAGVRREALGELVGLQRGELEPPSRGPVADDRKRVEPLGRRRQLPRRERVDQRRDAVGLLQDRRDRQVERPEEDEEQPRGHDRDGGAAPAAEPRLDAQHRRPRRVDDDRGPEQRQQERPQHPEAARDEDPDAQDGERDARDVVRCGGSDGRHGR